MDEHTLRVLEFYKVRDLLAAHASSEPGQAAVQTIIPSSDPKEVERSLKEAEELRVYLESRRDFPISGLRDITVPLKKSAVEGAVLRPEEFLDILSVARASRLLKGALSKARQECPLLSARASTLGVFEPMEFEINHAISSEGEVLDSASFELKRIRRSLTQTRSRINQELEEIIQSPAYGKAVQEPIITIRGDRYVLPLKPNFKLYLQGIVHDHSTSGSTVFVEPEKTVELNNRLVQMKVDEKREVERILWQLTATVREVGDALSASFAGLVELDVIYAKAAYANAIGASMPALATNGVIELKGARHPLLIKAKGASSTVPLDMKLGREFTSLVVTGPNTGGKTVALKTIGLLCLMSQAGMLIPASPDSVVSVFEDIFSDIGDEQSLEQSLSTFSSHISQIVRLLAKAGRNTLVLLDELGAGTDPAEGSALGVAILDELHRRGAKVVVTTHHGALKVFAANTPGVMNASVEFDSESLQPTYRLLVGRPGRSNALLIAQRLGMPKAVVDAAAKTRNADQVELDSLIERLEKEAQAAREDRRKAAQEVIQAREEKARLQDLVKRAEEERREAVRKAKEKASSLLSSLRVKLRELEELGKKQADRGEIRKKSDEVQALKAELDTEETTPAPEKSGLKIESLSVGDTVKVLKYRKSGKVLAIKKEKGQVVVQLDTMKVTIGVDELEHTGAVKQAAKPQTAGAYLLTRANDGDDYTGSAIELNIIGQRVDEAMERVEKFLDQCLLSGMNQARIVHGRGTGALRKAVWETLKANPAVSSYRHPAFEEGGDAVTVVEFRG